MNVFTAFEALDEKVVATSAAMAEATAALERHRDERRVFVFGESGVGVGWLCRWIHRTSERRHAPLVEVAVPSVSASEHERLLVGALEEARDGAVVVRCFEQLAPALQRRVLAAEGVHRLVATCYGNGGNHPARCVAADVLAGFAMISEIPPLRARAADLRELAVHLSRRQGEVSGWIDVPLDAEEEARLRAHDWPGNVRELAAAMAVRGYALQHGERWDRFAYLAPSRA